MGDPIRIGWCCKPELCHGHNTGPHHAEHRDRVDAIVAAFEAAAFGPPSVEALPATREAILRVHTEEHYDTIAATCSDGRDYPDPDTVMGPGSWEAAVFSAGSAIACSAAVVAGTLDRAFSVMRPPGHHAEADRAMGFCLFNNAAIAARWLQAEAGVKRVAILDWDAHHGNGTQHIFYDDDTVFYASIHQQPLYPGTGLPHETGKNHSNLNVAMPSRSGPAAWLEAMDTQVIPALEQFDPEVLLISCGFDAHRLDPLAGQRLETETFAELTRRVLPVANGRIVSVLEGGYHLGSLAESAAAHYAALGERA